MTRKWGNCHLDLDERQPRPLPNPNPILFCHGQGLSRHVLPYGSKRLSKAFLPPISTNPFCFSKGIFVYLPVASKLSGPYLYLFGRQRVDNCSYWQLVNGPFEVNPWSTSSLSVGQQKPFNIISRAKSRSSYNPLPTVPSHNVCEGGEVHKTDRRWSLPSDMTCETHWFGISYDFLSPVYAHSTALSYHSHQW